ncbi:MAG: winged helix-turn-helix domain-containing protein [Vulcanimicrobiaceae bacterium]
MDIVPPFDQIMRPLLEVLTNGQPHQLRELFPRVGDLMGLSQTAREECMASGALRFPNRLYWAKLYLKQAGAIEAVDRSTIRITERGRELLRRYPRSISQDALMEFEEYRAFIERSKPPKDRGKHEEEATLDIGATERTPLEVIQSAYQELREAVVQELLEAVRKAPPVFLEHLTVKLMMRLGYGDEENAGLVTGGPGDGVLTGSFRVIAWA